MCLEIGLRSLDFKLKGAGVRVPDPSRAVQSALLFLQQGHAPSEAQHAPQVLLRPLREPHRQAGLVSFDELIPYFNFGFNAFLAI